MSDAQQVQPGQYFDVPGVGSGTQWYEDFEPTQTLGLTFNPATQQPVNGILPFRQTDVVVDWIMELKVTQAYTAGTSTLTTSPYAPWNMIGPAALRIQNQYNSVDVESGIDLYIFNIIRPYRKTNQTGNLYANVEGQAAAAATGNYGYEAVANAQPNLLLPNNGQWTTATTSWEAYLRIPASITFDVYYDLEVTGEPVGSDAHSAIVSPQFLAGSTRVITPTWSLDALNGAQLDFAPVNIGAGSGTATATASLSYRRKAIYMADEALLPPVYAWQYRWHTSRAAVQGQNRVTVPIPAETGQLLMTYLRFWDPTQNGGLGAPVTLNDTTVTLLQVQYGSGLYRFNGLPTELQADFFDKHAISPPPGVFVYDMMMDELGRRTNRQALNTLTTSGIQWRVNFATALSVSTYCVLGTESLVFVA
jgi:hypothetical protein